MHTKSSDDKPVKKPPFKPDFYIQEKGDSWRMNHYITYMLAETAGYKEHQKVLLTGFFNKNTGKTNWWINSDLETTHHPIDNNVLEFGDTEILQRYVAVEKKWL